MAVSALEKFERMGWPITNTEIRFEIDSCAHAGYHGFERGHHVVVLCNESGWTMLHELGHVWSDLYLGHQARNELVERRGLEGWAGADIEWADRGTEHVAELIAFGLQDGRHAPARMLAHSDYRGLVEDFEWLFGVEPLHRGPAGKEPTGLESTARFQVVSPRTIVPAEAPAVEQASVVEAVASEYRFPMACGYPRWHSAHGGYGYEDPRDWTHVGVDLYAYEGTPVVAPVHGTVIDAGWHDIAGWKVVIEDRFGYRHRLVHLASEPVVGEGMEVAAGQHVGEVGRSGNAAGGGPHLHYEIRKNGETIDPMPWLERTDGHNIDRAPASFSTVYAPWSSDCDARL